MKDYSLSDNGLNLIKKWEGLRLKAYKDVGGILTIGYGWTGKVDGKNIYMGMEITESKATTLLLENVLTYCYGVNEKLNIEVTQNMFDAMVSLCYNVGVWAFQHSTLLDLVNRGFFKLASNEFDKWVKVGNTTIQGLVNRRADEKKLFCKYDNEMIESLNTLKNKVMRGAYGDGDDRKNKLKNLYISVQALINYEMNVINYDECCTILANEVIKGFFGDDKIRVEILGDLFGDVQKKVNEIYKNKN